MKRCPHIATHPRRLLMAAAALSLWTALNAQTLSRDYQYLKRTDPWLNGSNAAALTRFASQDIAEAELRLTRAKGGHTDFWESPNVVQVDASVESFIRLSSHAVVFGSMSYGNYAGDDMAGSAFMHQTAFGQHLPFDIIEDSLTNTGHKHRDDYRLEGGVGIDIWKGLSLGTHISYTAANYAKYKDLRHKNKLMDMQLSAGLYWPFAQWGSIGANYLYHRNTESLQFSTYGKTDRTYKSLVSYAALMGFVEEFGSQGYTDKSHEMPLVNDANGLSAQFSIHNKMFLFYNAFSYLHRTGYYGRRSPYTITYTEHNSNIYQYDAAFCFFKNTSRLRFDLNFTIENLQNKANTFRELQNDAGASYYEYYAPVKTADKLWTDVNAKLTLDLGIHQEHPTWTIEAGHSRNHRKQTAYLFPYYRRQQLDSYDLSAALTRHFLSEKGIWSLSLNGSFRNGSGEPYEELTFAQPSDKQETPASMEAYLQREYQWLTAPQYTIGGSVRYAFVMPGTRIKIFAQMILSHHKANQTCDYSQGCDRTTAILSIGCNF